ncbi:MAG: hypothetical protein H6922_02335 [Pseudomonadaceae bacterium]|nr:hypothetical protein [Pseudomonadaceae bacterium]
MRVRVGEGSYAKAVWQGRDVDCLIGRSGALPASDKREGDGATPLGRWQVLYGFYRADRVAKPKGKLLWTPLTERDGWCDGAGDALYNQWVPVGYGASHEVMWREDAAYDYVVVLSHNQPPVDGMGSAVFLHVWREEATHTAGCVALKAEDLVGVLDELGLGDAVEVVV